MLDPLATTSDDGIGLILLVLAFGSSIYRKKWKVLGLYAVAFGLLLMGGYLGGGWTLLSILIAGPVLLIAILMGID